MNESTFFSRIITKPQMQQTLRDLRKEGAKVERWGEGYKAFFMGDVVLEALQSQRSYLVRFNEYYFKA